MRECLVFVMIEQLIIVSGFCLLFQVSSYTGRVHLYTCILGTDTRPRPLFENFRPEEIELLSSLADDDEKKKDISVMDKPANMHALLEFLNEWKKLRPIERKKLLGKPLQLPLSVELCYLNESTSHNNKVCVYICKECSFFVCYEAWPMGAQIRYMYWISQI